MNLQEYEKIKDQMPLLSQQRINLQEQLIQIQVTWMEEFKEQYPSKNIWVWSGFLFDIDLKDKEILKYVDVLVDGKYNDELYDPTLKYCGSSNQRVIDVKKSLLKDKIILYE